MARFMELTRGPCLAPFLLALVVAVLGLASASHFRGATIQWKPIDPVNFDGRVRFTHRIAWRRGTAFCDDTTVSAGTLIGEAGELVCKTGCSGNVGSLKFQCTDFSVDEDWSAGQGSNEMNLTGSFEASYTGRAWITLVQGGGGWEIRVKGDLSPRADNGRINSSPMTAVSPVVRLRHGVTHTITLPVSDADGDIVRCRWAESSQNECSGVCQVFPATLDQDNCRLTYTANGSLGWYAVAIQVEDFISASSTVAMSSVPVQFLVLVQNITIPPGLTPPMFVGSTPVDGSCITVESTYQQQITARSGGDGAIIADISTVSPPGLMRSALTIGSNSQESYINVTWTPSPSKQGANIFCYTATDNFGLSSPQSCITLLVGVAAPQLTGVVLTSFRNGTFELVLQYDQQIARPSASRSVSVFEDNGMQVLSVDVSTSTDADYSGNTLTITTNIFFFTTRMYYLLADSGVAIATAFCAMNSPAITLPTEWPFGVNDTACLMNQYINPASPPGLPVCTPCPANSVSAGGDAVMCTCNANTGRVNESDVTLPCIACPGPPEAPTLISDVPPEGALSWSPPSASGAWSYTYEVSWTNGSTIVPRQAGTTGLIPGLQAETKYTVEITAYPDSTLCPAQSTTFTFMTTQRCPNPAPMFSSPPTVQPGVVMVSWSAAVVSDPLVTGVRYALYSQCGAETTFQLINDDIQGLSYDITTLPTLTQCVLRVVVYSDHCLLDVNGPLGDTTGNFTAVCRENEYVHPSSGECAACPTNSTSAGGTPSMCTCNAGTGRVNEADVTLPCLVCRENEYIHPILGMCTACPTNSTSAGGTPSMCTCIAGTGRVNESDVTLPCLVPPVVMPSYGINSKTANVGEPIAISFTVVNEPAPIVTREGIQWVFTGSSGSVHLPCNGTSKYTFSSDCLSLTVNNTAGSDAGLYQIILTNVAGTGMSAVALSVSGVPPEILIPLMNVSLSQGNTHMFVCVAISSPQPVFIFRFNGERLVFNSSKHTIVTNSTHATLTVSNIQSSDEGTYNCFVSTTFGSVSTAAVLTVEVPPVLTMFPSADRDVVKGENLVVTCQASGNPIPVIQWFKDNQPLNSGIQSEITVAVMESQSSNGRVTISQLTVMNFANEHKGMYSCVASNSRGNDSRPFQVKAVVRPKITSIKSSRDSLGVQNVSNGRLLLLEEFTPQLELACEAYGSPPPEIIWLRDGIALQNLTDQREITTSGLENTTRSILTLKEVELSDAGEYTCRASSGNVSPIPGTTAWAFTVNVTELYECDPNPCLNKGECVDGRQNYTCNCVFSPENGDILYTGRNCSTIVDTRIPPSVTANPSNVTVELHNRVTLKCSASGNPTPIVKWYKDNKPIEGPRAIGSTFLIQEATPDDRGFYHCEAINSVGRSNSTEALLLISGIVQFRIQTRVTGSRRKRQATSSMVDVESLRLQIVDQPLPVEGNLTATVYSVERATDNSNEIVITVSTNSNASFATLTKQLTQPLEQALAEAADINVQISALTVSVRRDGCPEEPMSPCGNAGTVTWPDTEIGQVANVSCPCGVSDPLIQELRGTRRCGGTYDTGAMWEEPQCDSCQFSDTRRTLCQLAEIDSPALLATLLFSATSNSEEIQSADISLILGLLNTVTNSPEDLLQESVQIDILSTVSNLHQVRPDELAIGQERTRTSSRILAIVETVLNVVNVAPGDPFQFAAPDFGVHVESPPEVLRKEDTFTPSIAGLLGQVMNITSANMPMGELPELPAAMVNLSSTLLRQDTTGSRPLVSAAIYRRDTLFQERQSFIARNNRETERVGSIIIDISLRLNGSVMSISRPPNSNVVRPIFTKSMLARNNGRDTTCQFWNFTADDGFGAWDGRNCRVLRETDEEVECGCDHLTHFAILLDVSPDPQPNHPNAAALTGVSYIGTTLSIISLTITIITFFGEKKLRKTVHAKLLINLCFALMGLYVTFIISTESYKVPVLCGLVSALMHYFFLAVFFWMAAEAIHLHRKLVTVFKPDIESYLAIAMAICWVIPAVIVTFSLAPHYQNYIHSQYCRVHGYSFWIGLLVPFGILYIMNWIIFILIFASLVCKHSDREDGSNHGKLHSLKENFTIALGLSLLFGIGWAVGLLASSDLPGAVRYPAEWIFTLMTAFLGVYLFVLYVLRSSDARRLWKRWLLCQHKKKSFVGVSNTSSSKATLGTFPSTVTSWWQSVKANILGQPLKDTTTSGSAVQSSPMSSNQYSSSFTSGKMTGMVSSHVEPSSLLNSTTAKGTPPPVEIELVHKMNADEESNVEEVNPSIFSPSKVPDKEDAEMESLVETMSFHDKPSMKRVNSVSSTNSPSQLSGAHEESYTAENKQSEGSTNTISL